MDRMDWTLRCPECKQKNYDYIVYAVLTIMMAFTIIYAITTFRGTMLSVLILIGMLAATLLMTTISILLAVRLNKKIDKND